MSQVPNPREFNLLKIFGGRKPLEEARAKAKGMQQALDAAGVQHKSATMTEGQAAKAMLDDMEADIAKILGKYITVDEALAKEITAMALSAALNVGAEPEAAPPEPPPVEEMEADPDAVDTEPLDDEDEDDPALKVKSLERIITKQTALIERFIVSQEAAETAQEAVTKSVTATNKSVEAVMSELTALKSRVGLIEAAGRMKPRASAAPETRLENAGIPPEIEKEMQAALQEVEIDPVWGRVNRK